MAGRPISLGDEFPRPAGHKPQHSSGACREKAELPVGTSLLQPGRPRPFCWEPAPAPSMWLPLNSQFLLLLGLGLRVAEVTNEVPEVADSPLNLVKRPASHFVLPDCRCFVGASVCTESYFLPCCFISFSAGSLLRLVEAWCCLSLFQTWLAGPPLK